MEVKVIFDEDFSNYKTPAMIIGFPKCTFKCDKDCGKQVCQNSTLAATKSFDISIEEIVDRYMKNNLTSAIVCGGLEPFDSYTDLHELIFGLRQKTDDLVIIYTGYNKDEIADKVKALSIFKNIIIKFGRFVPGQEKHFDEILGVELASKNQFAERIS